MDIIRRTKVARRWTDEDAALLRRMYRAGASNEEIAEALGRTLSAVMQQLAIIKRREKLFSS